MTMTREEAEKSRHGEMDELDRRAKERGASLCENFASLMKGDDRGATSSNKGLPR